MNDCPECGGKDGLIIPTWNPECQRCLTARLYFLKPFLESVIPVTEPAEVPPAV